MKTNFFNPRPPQASAGRGFLFFFKNITFYIWKPTFSILARRRRRFWKKCRGGNAFDSLTNPLKKQSKFCFPRLPLLSPPPVINNPPILISKTCIISMFWARRRRRFWKRCRGQFRENRGLSRQAGFVKKPLRKTAQKFALQGSPFGGRGPVNYSLYGSQEVNNNPPPPAKKILN